MVEFPRDSWNSQISKFKSTGIYFLSFFEAKIENDMEIYIFIANIKF